MIRTQEEFIPVDETTHQPLPTDCGFLDFDMNDRNVMIGGYDFNGEGAAHPHDQVPVFKVGDFGNLRAFRTPRYRRSLIALVMARVCGNRWCNTPEQFTQSWGNHATIESLDTDETAGKFDWWTNLWQVGQLMTIMVCTILETYLSPPLSVSFL